MFENFQDSKSYVLAISGGVDSVVLLHMLVNQRPKSKFIVAHVNHGLRQQSELESQRVHNLAKAYKLDFETTKLNLSKSSGQNQARVARYNFFHQIVDKYQAQALVTAHHQDDLIETMILNFIRGSRRRGLTSLKSTPFLLRPLLSMPKQALINYAQQHQLTWSEDPTNQNLKYLRNRIRHQILPKISSNQKIELLALHDKLLKINLDLDNFLNHYLESKSYRRQGRVFSRQWFNQLDHNQACEVVTSWLIKYKVPNYTTSQILYIVVKLRTLSSGKTIIISDGQSIKFSKRSLRLEL
ncbi:MAG: tRNA lysidine(34) synthetase TilS [Candidatus Saccharibacteria bacterium]|nr:tRNA lysidine(34) synthetase TilS [Candidatus Saccharibacteria bacterium]